MCLLNCITAQPGPEFVCGKSVHGFHHRGGRGCMCVDMGKLSWLPPRRWKGTILCVERPLPVVVCKLRGVNMENGSWLPPRRGEEMNGYE